MYGFGYHSRIDRERLVVRWESGSRNTGEVVICGLQEASVKYPDLFAKHYNHYAPVAHRDGLVALNTAFAQDGVFVYVPDDVVLECPLQIINS